MKCKKCGNDLEYHHYGALVSETIKCYKNRKEPIPELLTTSYKDYHRYYGCEKCGEPIDYKDMPIDMFFGWLEYSAEAGDSREASGKALIRYFEFDKLLKLKKDAGD